MKLIDGFLFLLSFTAPSAPRPTPDDPLRLDPRILPITESLDLQLESMNLSHGKLFATACTLAGAASHWVPRGLLHSGAILCRIAEG